MSGASTGPPLAPNRHAHETIRRQQRNGGFLWSHWLSSTSPGSHPLDLSRGGPSLRRALKYIIGGAAGAAVPAVLIVGEAYADTGDDALAAVTKLSAATNLLWVVIGAVLVIFMQAGFALV